MKRIFSIVILAVVLGMTTANAQETKKINTNFSDQLFLQPASFSNLIYSKPLNELPKEANLKGITFFKLDEKWYNEKGKTGRSKLTLVLSKRISTDTTTAQFLGYPLKGLTTQMLTFNEGTIIGDAVLVYRFKQPLNQKIMEALILNIQSQFASRIYNKLIDGYLLLLETGGNLCISYRDRNRSTIKKGMQRSSIVLDKNIVAKRIIFF